MQTGAAKASSPGGAATAVSPSVSPKAGLPKAQATGIVEDLQVKPAAKGPSSSKAVRAVSLSPAEAAADDQDIAAASAADDGLGFLVEEAARPKRGAAPAVAVEAGEPISGETRPADDLAAIAALAARSSKAAAVPRSKTKKRGLPAWLMISIAAVGVGCIVGIGSMIYMSGANWSPSNRAPASPSTANNGKTATQADKETPKVPLLTVDWPENQRVRAALFVNGKKSDVPLTGPIEIPIPPRNEQYHFRLERPGFQPKQFARAAGSDDQAYNASEWEPLAAKNIAWPQDFEDAKKTAAKENKNVFILFDASDAEGSSFASSRFKEAIAMRPEFDKRAEKKYACIYIDNPKKAEAQAEVKDAGRNGKLTEQFGITVFPTVVVTDPKGRPFGVLEGYKINGITPFLELLDKWATDRKQLFDLLAKLEAAPKESPNPELAGEVLDFLELSKLDRFYAGTIKKAAAFLPKGEGRPVTKDLAEMWMRRLALAAKNADEAKKVVDEFDKWKKMRTFKDPEMGAALHLTIALILARLDLRKEAAEKCKEGLALQPHNPMVKSYLEQFSRLLSVEPGKPVMMPVGSGTGYCIAQGNYLLTNHHVIRKAKEIKVRLNGETEMHAAKLIADNESGDMAILKVDLPAGRKLVPLPLMARELKIGEDVCAFGWPGMMSQNLTLTLTKGVVSTLPDADNDESFIVTDCTINPGNSGGPLCSLAGGVAGMVTRKSRITSHESSYGMAIPVGRLRKFLTEKLPRDAKMPPALGATAAKMERSDLGEKITPSVVYIENLQEVHSPGREGPGQEEQDPELEPGD